MVIIYLSQVIWEIESRCDGTKSGDSQESIRLHYGISGKCEKELEEIAENEMALGKE